MSNNGLRLLDYPFERPIVTIRMVDRNLDCSFVTAARVIEDLERLGIVTEFTGWKRNRRYRYEPYLELFERHALAAPESDEHPETPTTLADD